MQKPQKNKLCERCKARFARVEHHILPRALGGSNAKSNKQWLCHECHKQIHVFMRYPKHQRTGKPFFANELATYYGKDSHAYKKAEFLEKVNQNRAQARYRSRIRKNGIQKRTEIGIKRDILSGTTNQWLECPLGIPSRSSNPT